MNDSLFNEKNEIIELIMSLNQDIKLKHNLVDYLVNNTDYFVSPFSTRYLFSYDGGLVSYCLKVYNNLSKLVNSSILSTTYSNDVIITVSLFHALYKVGRYKKIIRNVKNYNDNGVKFDEMGHFDWTTKVEYVYNDERKDNLYGDLGFTSYMIISKYLPLSEDEILAIKYCNLWEDNRELNGDMYDVIKSCPLVALLNSAILLTMTNE